MRDIDKSLAETFAAVADALRSLAPKVVAAIEWVQKNEEVVVHLLGQVLEGGQLQDTGWLPHPILASLNIGVTRHADLKEVVEKHYRVHWPILKDDFAESLLGSGVDGQAQDTFTNAMQLHEMGQYRAVCRLIFPELERLVRKDLMGRRFGAATNLNELRTRLVRLPIAVHVADPRSRALSLMTTLDTHLFEKVDTEEALFKFEASGIPNRHACMHGVIDYNSFQNSMNMLIIAQYCYDAIGRVQTLSAVPGKTGATL